MFLRYSGPGNVMDNYRRPRPAVNRTRQAVDGFIPAPKTNTRPQINSLRAVQSAPARRAAPIVQKQRLTPEQKLAAQPYRAKQAAASRRLPALNLELDGAEGGARRHFKTPIVRNRLQAVRRWSFRTAAATLILIVGVGGLLFSQGYLKLHKVFKGTAVSAASLQKDVNPNLLKGEGDGRVNILLLGIGGQAHDGPDLTDTIMLASIDPVNNTATLLSVPRDLWVTLPGHGAMKINAAYETGKYGYLHKNTADNSNFQAIQAGFSSADQTVEGVLGVPIDYNVLVDFQAFRQAIDTVGGVSVNVPSELYDPTMAWENGNNPVLAQPGVQTMNGTKALIYVRSRETSSDFARSERQRSVLLALKDKAITLGVLSNPAKISGLINAFGNNVKTDLSLSDANRLYSIFKGINNNDVKSASLAGDTTTTSGAAGNDSLVTTGDINGQSVVEPKAGLNNYGAIQTYVHSQLQDGYLLKEHALVQVLNGTGIAGLGQTESATLKSYGYSVATPGNAPHSGYLETIVVDMSHGHDPYTKHYLEQRFSTTAVTKLPQGISNPTNAKFIVLLGGDAAGSN